MVDVGFAEPPLHPLAYVFDEEQVTPEGMTSRIVVKEDKKNVELEWYKDGEWRPRLRWEVDAPFCTSALPAASLSEMLELVCDPAYNFSAKLVVVRLTRDVKQTLAGNIHKRTDPPRFGEGCHVTPEEVGSLEQVRELLNEEFGIAREETETIDIRSLASQDPKVLGSF
jgi:arylamine N-acetyltransferase